VQWSEYPPGTTIFWEGDPALGLYILHYGWLKVIRTASNGREQVLKFLGPGESFNEIGALAHQTNPATAISLETSMVGLLPRATMQNLITTHPTFALYLIEKLALRVNHLVTLIADLSLRSVTGRLASLLLSTSKEDVVHRPRWYTQAELAARLGTVPDVVQRALRQLADEGVIEVARHEIRVLDVPALRRWAES
jgi:CRP/FNR family transcriptional regulator